MCGTSWLAIPILLICAAEEPDPDYVRRFEERFRPVTPAADWDAYAVPERYDELYLGASLDAALQDVQNDQGGLAWGLAYRMLSLNAMYRATGNPVYLEANKRCVLAAARATDDRREKTLWTGVVAPVWGCDIYSGRGRAAFAVHTGIIAWPMLEYVRLADGVEGCLRDEQRREIVDVTRTALAFHDRQWRDGPCSGEGHYVGKEQEPICEDKPLPGNRLSAMGMALWHSSLLDGHALHRDRARALGRYLQNRLALGTDDAYYWPYWLPEFPVQGTIDRLEVQGEDLSHASLTAQLALTLGAANEVFAREDLARLSRTVTRGFARLGHGVLLGSINGDPASDPAYVGSAAVWLALAETDPEVAPRIREHYLRYVASPVPWELALLIEQRKKSVPQPGADDGQLVEPGGQATKAFPAWRLHQDWIYQDHGLEDGACFTDTHTADRERQMVERVLAELDGDDPGTSALRARLSDLTRAEVAGADARWRELYVRACQRRRQARLATLRSHAEKIVFTKHYFLSGVVHYAWTDHITDQQYSERNADYRMGASLELLTIGQDGDVQMETLWEAPEGIIRDPNVSYDGTQIVFSMRRNDVDDDYHLYVMDVATRNVKQITFGLGVSDIEPCYLPDGEIVFVSSRCIQLTDCWRQAVSNLFTCDGEGRFLRRLGYDQVHTNYPQTLADGRVIYTRWEYNDRGQIFPQPLFVMNGDGTGQAEFYGGNSWFPTSILHARGVPGTQKVIGIASGHHTTQRGKLVLVDRSKGTQEAAGIEYLAPRRPAEAVRVDQFGWEGEQFQYPYAFDEQTYLVTYCPEGSPHPQNGPFPVPYGVYFLTEDGRRELLAYDETIHCNQPVPLRARKVPPARVSQVDYTRSTGAYYVQDVHAGQAMAGVPRGTVKNLRVVAIEYRAADAYYNSNVGEAGVSHSRTPPAINNGSWDVKHVLGTVPVESDGSAYFEVPARTPVYFQLLDERGYVVQTMRSWSTLQPGETQTCVGCHESKHDTPPAAPGQALRAGVRKLTPFDRFAAQHGARNPITDPTLSGPAAVQALLTVNNPGGFGEAGGFRYVREIQPILDQHCVRCHTGATTTDGGARQMNLTGEVLSYTYTQCPNNGDSTQDARRAFTASYLNLTRFGHGDGPVNWISAQSRPTLLPPYFAGAATSPLMQYLEPSHHGVQLSRLEKERVACWIDLGVPFCGSYTDANHWEPEVKATYAYFEAKRGRWAEIEVDNLRKLWAARAHGARFSLEDFQVFDLGGPAARRQFEQAWLETHARAPATHASQPAE